MEEELRLKSLIDNYDDLYYNQDISMVTDEEYDMIKKNYLEVAGIEEIDFVPGVADPSAEKIVHHIPIKSLGKVNSLVDLKTELLRLAPGIIEPKYDGLTVVFYPAIQGNQRGLYKGNPYRAATRGNGEVGEDITENTKKILQVSCIDFEKINFSFRAEAYMKLSTFKAINEQRVKDGLEPHQNPRNAAAGILRRKDSSKVEGISITAYDIIDSTTNECAKLNMLYHAGIPVPDPKKCFKFNDKNLDEAIKWVSSFDRTSLDYEIDGLVAKSDTPNSLAIFGGTGHHPKNAVAYKFPSTGKWTTLESVTWQVGRTGVLTPVAELNPPVSILGSTVSRCTLHNLNYINTLNLELGQEVHVIKANDVIPRITEGRGRTYNGIMLPLNCPVCNSVTEMVKDLVYCRNPLCRAKLTTGVMHLAKKDSLDIESLAEGTIEKMVEANLINIPTDIFKLTEEQIMTLPSFKMRSSKKLYKNIQGAKTAPLGRFIYAAGIPEIGRTASKDIANMLYTFADLMMDIKTGCNKIKQIPGIGSIMVDNIIKYQQLLGLLFMSVAPVDLVKPVPVLQQTSAPTGMPVPTNYIPLGRRYNIVLTGTMSRPRGSIEFDVHEKGHNIQNSVNGSTDYLVCADPSSNTTKMQKAIKQGVQILSEDALMILISR